MNMAVAYQRDREPRRRSHERVETARVQVRTKSRPRHLAVSARGMLVMVIVSSLLFCVLVGLIYIKYLIRSRSKSMKAAMSRPVWRKGSTAPKAFR